MDAHTDHTCLTEEQIDELTWAVSSEDILAQFSDDVLQCPHCREQIEMIRQNRDLVKTLRGSDLQIPEWSSPSIGTATRISHSTTIIPRRKKQKSTTSSSDRYMPEIPGYKLVREIHRGGQGIVFEALQESTDRTVALKVMAGSAMADEHLRWRFEQEVHLVASLKHPNIVGIHESGIHEGRYYYSMDYVRGQPLDTHIRLEKLSDRDIVRLFSKICGAIAYAHSKGVIHRDLKPSNILVGERGEPQVLDFGLAKLIQDSDSEESINRPMTKQGQIMGTLRYLSPEQTIGDPDSIGAETDIYSLGLMMYEFLAGEPPYETEAMDLFQAISNIRKVEPVRLIRKRHGFSRDLDAVVLHALEKEPERRYQTASAFQADLNSWLDGMPVLARSSSSLYIVRKIATKHWLESAVAAVILVIFVSTASIAMRGYWYGQEMEVERNKADFALNSRLGLETEVATAQRRMTLGWLLLCLKSNIPQLAQHYYEQMPEGTPEREAAAILLGEKDGSEFDRDSAEVDPIIRFAMAESLYRQGSYEQSKRLFTHCLTMPPVQLGIWNELAKERLDQIEVIMNQENKG